MRRIVLATTAALVVTGTAVVLTQGGFKNIKEFLTGYEEVFGGGGAISTEGHGTFTARISNDGSSIGYTLSYDDLEGDVTQAHIHFGQRGTTGGISVWLCQTEGSPAPPAVFDLTPLCPEPGGSVSGTLTAASVIGPAGQGIEAEAFDELVAAIRAGVTYVNVHTSKWPTGEIRSQITHEGHDR